MTCPGSQFGRRNHPHCRKYSSTYRTWGFSGVSPCSQRERRSHVWQDRLLRWEYDLVVLKHHQTENKGRSMISCNQDLQCRAQLFSSKQKGALTSPYTAALSSIKETSWTHVPSGSGMPPGGRLAYNLPFGRSETSASLCINADLRSPRVTSRWRTAATNKKVYIEDVCGVREDRSRWRMSGSRWPRTHHRHLAFESAPTSSPGFSR